MVRTRVNECMCVSNKMNSELQVDFWCMGSPRQGEYRSVKMVYAALSLTKKMRSKCAGHEISIGHILAIFQHRMKMFSILMSAPKWL